MIHAQDVARPLLLVAMLVLGGCLSVPDPDVTVGVPDRFQGEWNRNIADCGTANNDSTLVLSANRIAFHDSRGQVLSAIVTDQLDLAVTARMQGEGETWNGTWKFRLSDARTTLTEMTAANGIVRYRCP